MIKMLCNFKNFSVHSSLAQYCFYAKAEETAKLRESLANNKHATLASSSKNKKRLNFWFEKRRINTKTDDSS